MATDARAVNTLVKQNMVSKATTRLIGDNSFCREPDAHQKVRGLFPTQLPPNAGPPAGPAPDEFREQVIIAIRKSLRRLPRNSGPGPNGSRFEHWACLTADEDAEMFGAEVIADFLIGNCPAEALEANLGGRLMALNKSDGGIRPIAMGSTIRRIAAKAACAVLKPDIPAAVGTFQYGVGKSAGCELIHKLVTALTDEDQTRVVISYDARNAFGSLPRQRIWDATL